MKNFVYNLFVVSIALDVVSAEEQFDICEVNDGNIQIYSAFRWKSSSDSLYIFGENGLNFKLNDFKWDKNKMVFKTSKIERLDSKDWETKNFKSAFTLKYPDNRDSVVEISVGQIESIDTLMANVFELDSNQKIVSRKSVSINVYKCGSTPEPMNLCSLLGKFPQEELHKNLISISSFPWVLTESRRKRPLPQRLFVYYRETPPTPTISQCPGCYQSKRFVFISSNMTFGNKTLNGTNWQIDSTSDSHCIDLNGVIVNSSVAVTDYIENGTLYQFQLIEFSGIQYSLYRVSLTAESLVPQSLNFEKLSVGSIGSLFECQKTTQPFSEYPTKEVAISESETQFTEGPVGKPVVEAQGLQTEIKGTTPQTSGGSSAIWIVSIILLILIVIAFVVMALIIRRGGVEVSQTKSQPQLDSESTNKPSSVKSEVISTSSHTKSIKS